MAEKPEFLRQITSLIYRPIFWTDGLFISVLAVVLLFWNCNLIRFIQVAILTPDMS